MSPVATAERADRVTARFFRFGAADGIANPVRWVYNVAFSGNGIRGEASARYVRARLAAHPRSANTSGGSSGTGSIRRATPRDTSVSEAALTSIAWSPAANCPRSGCRTHSDSTWET
jgi:hypothetical protein